MYTINPIFRILALILFTTSFTRGQQNTLVKDFNKDKTFDFLVEGMEWLEVDSWDYVLTDGKTGKRWGYASSTGYYGSESFISIGKTRNELGEGWDKVINALEDTLLNYQSETDPSLEWVLNTQIVNPGLSSVTMFDHVIQFEKKWYDGNPLIAENYTYRMDEKNLTHIEEPDSFETYYLYYRSHNHKEEPQDLEEEDIYLKGNGLHKTKHALIEIRDDQYAWVFMSGVSPTGGPSKLRWASMHKVESHSDLVFLQQQVVVGEYAFWVGDLEKGLWARISNPKFEDRVDFEIKDEKLRIIESNGNESLSISISDIEKAMLHVEK